jgi:hypothetical protein
VLNTTTTGTTGTTTGTTTSSITGDSTTGAATTGAATTGAATTGNTSIQMTTTTTTTTTAGQSNVTLEGCGQELIDTMKTAVYGISTAAFVLGSFQLLGLFGSLAFFVGVFYDRHKTGMQRLF